MDLKRLRVYVNERVKESKRLAASTSHESIRRAHSYSALVGEQILQEIDEQSPKEPQ